jgi:hypothetical protein
MHQVQIPYNFNARKKCKQVNNNFRCFDSPTKHTAVDGMASRKCLNTADNGQEDETMHK